MAWALDSFRAGFDRTDNSEETEALIKWGADCLISAWKPDKQAFVAVVGDSTTDFDYYGPIEECHDTVRGPRGMLMPKHQVTCMIYAQAVFHAFPSSWPVITCAWP